MCFAIFSIYADISEFQLKLNFQDQGRKESNFSNTTTDTMCTSPYPIPPARSNSMSKCEKNVLKLSSVLSGNHIC